MKDATTDKHYISDTMFDVIMDEMRKVEKAYADTVFHYHDNVTKRQAKDEFWSRVAEHYGFKMQWNRECTPRGDQ